MESEIDNLDSDVSIADQNELNFIVKWVQHLQFRQKEVSVCVRVIWKLTLQVLVLCAEQNTLWLRCRSHRLKVVTVSSVEIFWQFKIMDRSIKSKTILYLFMSCTLCCIVHAQHPDGTILLKQGVVIGVRVNGIIYIFNILSTWTYQRTNAPVTCFNPYISAENFPGNFPNGSLLVPRNSIRSTAHWFFAICREFRSVYFIHF